jgi:hypothetical protein
MIVAIAETVKRPPQHSLWLVKAAPSGDQALLDLGDGQVGTILRIGALRSIPNTKAAPATDLAPASKHHPYAPTAPRADHPNPTPTKVQGCGREPNLSCQFEAVLAGQCHLKHSAFTSCGYEAYLCRAVGQVKASESFRKRLGASPSPRSAAAHPISPVYFAKSFSCACQNPFSLIVGTSLRHSLALQPSFDAVAARAG